MKKHLNIKTIALAIISIGYIAGCGKGESDLGPRSSIYKTKGDYLNYVHIWAGTRAPNIYTVKDGRIKIEGGDTISANRLKLIDGYIFAEEANPSDYFTDITFAELTGYNENHPDLFPKDSMFERVIDEEPYLEFYIDKAYEFGISNLDEFDLLTVEQLNEIIQNGELEKYFDRVK
jgi:hypothetical protein